MITIKTINKFQLIKYSLIILTIATGVSSLVGYIYLSNYSTLIINKDINIDTFLFVQLVILFTITLILSIVAFIFRRHIKTFVTLGTITIIINILYHLEVSLGLSGNESDMGFHLMFWIAVLVINTIIPVILLSFIKHIYEYK